MLGSLLHRLPPLEPGRRPIINEPQPDMHPLEILADVKKLLDVKHVSIMVVTVNLSELMRA